MAPSISMFIPTPLSCSSSTSLLLLLPIPNCTGTFRKTSSPNRLLSSPRHFNRRHISQAKFDKFDAPIVESEGQTEIPIEKEVSLDEDSDLPNDLVGAIQQSGKASAAFASAGGLRSIVELLIPQLESLDKEGAQAELWELSRVFLDTLIEETGVQVKAIFPDSGSAALLKFQWKDARFGIASLSDQKPVDKDDEIVVMILPSYQMLECVERIASDMSDDLPRPLIMWNPRLFSLDVGVGFNVRRLRQDFLSTFSTVYSMRPLPDGAVFRCYPGMWKVFSDDKDRPNRYLLAKEQSNRPDSTDLEIIFGEFAEKSGEDKSLFSKVGSVFSSINRFMKAIS